MIVHVLQARQISFRVTYLQSESRRCLKRRGLGPSADRSRLGPGSVTLGQYVPRSRRLQDRCGVAPLLRLGRLVVEQPHTQLAAPGTRTALQREVFVQRPVLLDSMQAGWRPDSVGF